MFALYECMLYVGVYVRMYSWFASFDQRTNKSEGGGGEKKKKKKKNKNKNAFLYKGKASVD